MRVRSLYVPHRSRPEASSYFFAYRIELSNEGAAPVQLRNRHWIITHGYSCEAGQGRLAQTTLISHYIVACNRPPPPPPPLSNSSPTPLPPTPTHSDGRVDHVRGPGVVGATPTLLPGASFEYTSGECPALCLGGDHFLRRRLGTFCGGVPHERKGALEAPRLSRVRRPFARSCGLSTGDGAENWGSSGTAGLSPPAGGVRGTRLPPFPSFSRPLNAVLS